jgi:hypothetical protein
MPYNPKSTRWVVELMAFSTFVLNRNGNLNVPYVYDDGGTVHVNWNWLDNDWNDNNPAVLSATLFISSAPRERKFVHDLVVPPTEHASDFFKFC